LWYVYFSLYCKESNLLVPTPLPAGSNVVVLQREEEEWQELKDRFIKEGLEYDNLNTEKRLLHVWRWLVDAESNLKSLRKTIDKLREQQHEDLEEMECYVGHIKELANKRAGKNITKTVLLRIQRGLCKLLLRNRVDPRNLY